MGEGAYCYLIKRRGRVEGKAKRESKQKSVYFYYGSYFLTVARFLIHVVTSVDDDPGIEAAKKQNI